MRGPQEKQKETEMATYLVELQKVDINRPEIIWMVHSSRLLFLTSFSFSCHFPLMSFHQMYKSRNYFENCFVFNCHFINSFLSKERKGSHFPYINSEYWTYSIIKYWGLIINIPSSTKHKAYIHQSHEYMTILYPVIKPRYKKINLLIIMTVSNYLIAMLIFLLSVYGCAQRFILFEN